MWRYFLFLALASCFGGCDSSAVNKYTLKEGEIFAVDLPAHRRGAYLVNGRAKVCVEPPSDIGVNLSKNKSGEIDSSAKSLGNVGVSYEDALASSMTELRGRTPAVLSLRDVMYRMCEARLVHKDGVIPDKELEIFNGVIKVIGDFAKADLNNAQEQKAKAEGRSEMVVNAKAYEKNGYEALLSKSWKEAQQAFENCEKSFNGFGACYELSRDLKSALSDPKSTDRTKSLSLLKHQFRMPQNVKAYLEGLGG